MAVGFFCFVQLDQELPDEETTPCFMKEMKEISINNTVKM